MALKGSGEVFFTSMITGGRVILDDPSIRSTNGNSAINLAMIPKFSHGLDDPLNFGYLLSDVFGMQTKLVLPPTPPISVANPWL